MNMDSSHEPVAQGTAQTLVSNLDVRGKHALFTPDSSQQSDMEYWLIDKTTDIEAALNVIRKHSLIAVDCEGVNLSTEGALCLLQIGIRISPMNHRCYLFDIQMMGKLAFEYGLADLLTSPKI